MPFQCSCGTPRERNKLLVVGIRRQLAGEAAFFEFLTELRKIRSTDTSAGPFEAMTDLREIVRVAGFVSIGQAGQPFGKVAQKHRNNTGQQVIRLVAKRVLQR